VSQDVTISGVLLAAGSGSRLGTPKAQLVLNGRRLLDRGVDVLRAAGCDQCVAVLREPEPIGDVVSVVNPDPDRGMGSSLRLGLGVCTGSIAVVMLVDTPGVGADAVRRVCDAVQAGAKVAIASYKGHNVPPVAFAREVWDEVAELAVGDQGARGFLRAHPELVVSIACEGDPSDIDTAADLARWRSRCEQDESAAPAQG
jgi:CTP:molybdopterin cytidylyltransferase MocA